MVEVRRDEGIANYIGREPCVRESVVMFLRRLIVTAPPRARRGQR